MPRWIFLGVFWTAPGAFAQQVEVIEDDAASAPVSAPTAAVLPAAQVGGRLHQRAQVDSSFDSGTGEDIVETRTRLDLHAEAPMTERLSARLAARLDHRLHFAEQGGNPRGAAEPRLLDAYLDADLGRLDLRVGQQVVAWGRVDVFPTADFLNPPDLTDGMATDFEAAVVPVPAVRADFTATDWLSLAAVYEPFFVPARVALFGTDFALIGPGAPASARAAVSRLRGLVDASVLEDVQDDLLATQVPDEWFVNGQVGGRVEARGPEGAVAAAVFQGYEKVPTIRADPLLREYLADPTDVVTALDLFARVSAGDTVYRSRYRRMTVLALDGEMPAGPFLLRFDLGWTPARTLYAVDDGACALPCALRAGVVQGAFQAEYSESDRWWATVEIVALHATRGPSVGALALFGDTRTLTAAVAGLRRSLLDGDLEISAFSLATWAPASVIATGGATVRIVEGLRLEGGGLLYEGFGDDESPGALYDPNDAAYGGVRYDF